MPIRAATTTTAMSRAFQTTATHVVHPGGEVGESEYLPLHEHKEDGDHDRRGAEPPGRDEPHDEQEEGDRDDRDEKRPDHDPESGRRVPPGIEDVRSDEQDGVDRDRVRSGLDPVSSLGLRLPDRWGERAEMNATRDEGKAVEDGDQEDQRLVPGDERRVLEHAADHRAQEVGAERHVRTPRRRGTDARTRGWR